MVYKSKRTGYGLVEITDSSILGWYALCINGKVISQSASLSFIEGEYAKY